MKQKPQKYSTIAKTWKGLILISILYTSIFTQNSIIQLNKSGFAINGYDPVAYFSDNEAVYGDTSVYYKYKDIKWSFKNNDHKFLFMKNPKRYIPQYGGYCAYGVKWGLKVITDPKNYNIIDNKLYLNLNPKIKKRWERKTYFNIKRADRKWQKIKHNNINH